MEINEIKEKAENFSETFKDRLKNSYEAYEEFISSYPFKEHPKKINSIKPEDIYNPGKKTYFFYYIEFGLKDFGSIRVGKATFAENASKNIDKFKKLLEIAVDDAITIANKIDAPWEEIKYFGGDKHVAKKIIFCYNSTKILPIYKTQHLEHFAKEINGNFKSEPNKFNKTYENLTLGEKLEYLNQIILKFKNDKIKSEMDNVTFMHFLYTFLNPDKSVSVWTFTVNMELNPDFKERKQDIWNSAKEVKKGDIILFYCGKPHSHIADIFIAESDPYEDRRTKEDWKTPAVDILKKIEIKNAIQREELIINPILKEWAAVKMNFARSHFKISKKQWAELKRLILKKNPELEKSIHDLENPKKLKKNIFLKFLNEIYSQEMQMAIGELERGKNVIFYGPPGSGKTVLSKIVSEEYLGKDAYFLYTVHSGTDYYDLVCRIVPQINEEGNLVYSKERRFLLDALLSGKVLILDEINRTQIDTALGIFFTYLEKEHRVNDAEQIMEILEKEIDEELELDDLRDKLSEFRIIGTLNVYDKTFLFKLGDALKRRFTFIEITTTPELLNDLIVTPEEFISICNYEGDQGVANTIINVFTELNRIKPLGIGILKEALQFSLYFPKDEAADTSVSSLVVPFFENDLNYSMIRGILEKYGLNNSLNKLKSLNFGTSDINGI